MKLPFIQHNGIGIHITQHAIRWVEISRINEKLKLKKVAVEKVENDLASSLNKLIGKLNISFPYVTVNIDGSHVKQKLIELPDFDEQEYLQYWVEEQQKDLIPKGLNQEEFVIKHHFVGVEPEQRYALFITARKQAIVDRVELLRTAGLKPVAITTGHLQAGYGLAFDEKFIDGKAPLLSIYEDGSTLHLYNQGVLSKYYELSGSWASISEAVDEAITILVSDGSSQNLKEQIIHVAASEYYNEAEPPSTFTEPFAKNTVMVQLLSELSGVDNSISSDFAIACGMAIRQLYPAMDTINLLGAEEHEIITKEIQKKDAFLTGILSGGAVVLVFLLLMIAQFFLSSNLENATQQVARMSDKIDRVNLVAEKVTHLNDQVVQARALVEGRTSMAEMLEVTGRSLPNRVWLNELSFSKSETGNEVTLYGYAHNDALVAALMERLEKETETQNVRLIYSESVSSEDVYDNSSFENVNLVQFEVRMTMKSKSETK